jgi:hypothetical protein
MQARILEGDRLRATTGPAEIRAALAGHQRIWIDLARRRRRFAKGRLVLVRSAILLYPFGRTVEEL